MPKTKTASVTPLFGAAMHTRRVEPLNSVTISEFDEVDIPLDSTELDDEDLSFLSAGVLSPKKEKRTGGESALLVGSALVAGMAVIGGFFYLQSNNFIRTPATGNSEVAVVDVQASDTAATTNIASTAADASANSTSNTVKAQDVSTENLATDSSVATNADNELAAGTQIRATIPNLSTNTDNDPLSMIR